MQEESIRKDRRSQFKIYVGANVHYSSGSKTVIHMEVEIMSEVGGRKKEASGLQTWLVLMDKRNK